MTTATFHLAVTSKYCEHNRTPEEHYHEPIFLHFFTFNAHPNDNTKTRGSILLELKEILNMGYSEIKIEYYLYTPEGFTSPLTNEWEMAKDMKEEADKVFALYKIEAEFLEAGGRGGGFDSFIELVKNLWEHREPIQLGLTLLVGALNMLKLIRSRAADSGLTNSKPRYGIEVRMIHNGEFERNAEVPQSISNYVVNLKFVADQIVKTLSERFPLFVFDENVTLFIPAKKIYHKYKFTSENQSKYTLSKFVKIAKNLPFSPGKHVSHSFGILTKRQETFEDGHRAEKTYWLLVSIGILADWRYKFRTLVKAL